MQFPEHKHHSTMGIILRQIQEAILDHGVPEIGTSVTRAHTGRVSESFTTEQQVCENLVNGWLDGASDDPMHWGRQLVRELVAELPRCTAPLAYRARGFHESTFQWDPLEFGPSPFRPAGRYNRFGQPALYLARDLPGLIAEMERYSKPGEHYYFVQYRPPASLSLVDVSDANAHAALHLAFDRAERLDLDYEAPRRLADVVRELQIDGIVVPGVRGTKGHHYCNVVIFNCSEWATWVDIDRPPEPLAG